MLKTIVFAKSLNGIFLIHKKLSEILIVRIIEARKYKIAARINSIRNIITIFSLPIFFD